MRPGECNSQQLPGETGPSAGTMTGEPVQRSIPQETTVQHNTTKFYKCNVFHVAFP